MVSMFPAMAPRSTSAHARSAVVSDDGPSGVTTSRFRAPPRADEVGVGVPVLVRFLLVVIPLPIVSTHGDGALLCDAPQRR